MNAYLALFVYVITLIFITVKLTSKKPISEWDYFGVSLSYVFFGLAFVLEKIS